jgi:hypothetical protein
MATRPFPKRKQTTSPTAGADFTEDFAARFAGAGVALEFRKRDG